MTIVAQPQHDTIERMWKAGRILGVSVFGVAMIGLPVAVFFYPWILTCLAKFLALSQPPERADLILVLGGDFFGPRALKGAELGSSGYASTVLISGPPYRDRPESELSIQFLVEKGFRRELFISFPIPAGSTIEEAIAVCRELRRLRAKKVLIVTSAYHSRRANIVYRLFCPEVRLVSIAAPDPQFEVESWWKTPRYRDVFFSEWKKIVGTIFWEYPKLNLKLLARPFGATPP